MIMSPGSASVISWSGSGTVDEHITTLHPYRPLALIAGEALHREEIPKRKRPFRLRGHNDVKTTQVPELSQLSAHFNVSLYVAGPDGGSSCNTSKSIFLLLTLCVSGCIHLGAFPTLPSEHWVQHKPPFIVLVVFWFQFASIFVFPSCAVHGEKLRALRWTPRKVCDPVTLVRNCTDRPGLSCCGASMHRGSRNADC